MCGDLPQDDGALLRDQVWELIVLLANPSLSSAVPRGALRTVDLTRAQFDILLLLDGRKPQPMNVLAESMGCDPSWMTSVVDGLESRGLVRRRSALGDRRVKVVEVSEAGAAVRTKLVNRSFGSAAKLDGLGPSELRQLHDLLSKIVVASPRGRMSHGTVHA